MSTDRLGGVSLTTPQQARNAKQVWELNAVERQGLSRSSSQLSSSCRARARNLDSYSGKMDATRDRYVRALYPPTVGDICSTPIHCTVRMNSGGGVGLLPLLPSLKMKSGLRKKNWEGLFV